MLKVGKGGGVGGGICGWMLKAVVGGAGGGWKQVCWLFFQGDRGRKDGKDGKILNSREIHVKRWTDREDFRFV